MRQNSDSALAHTLEASLETAKTHIDDAFTTGETLLHTGDALATRLTPSVERGTTASARRTVVPRIVHEQGKAVLVSATEERYRLEERIGQGGMGEVNRVFDRDIGRTVAVKSMLAEASGPHGVARFVDEIRTLGKLDHPNIVAIHDVDVDAGGNLFFTMPLVDGVPLDAIFDGLVAKDPATVTAYPLSRRLDIFAGILDALAHAHAKGILHRDVKPANVMIGRHGEVVLLDWGIARSDDTRDVSIESANANASAESSAPGRLSPKTRHGHLVGTPHYMAPEQARGAVSEIGPSTDVYAAFVVLFELLTLSPYVTAETSEDALAEVLSKQAPSTDGDIWVPPYGEPVPVEIRHFVKRGLRGDPKVAFATAESALTELSAIRSGDFRVDCPITFTKRTLGLYTRFLERHLRLGMISVAAIPLVVLALFVCTLFFALR
jgi:serine/threonine protein kinase